MIISVSQNGSSLYALIFFQSSVQVIDKSPKTEGLKIK